MLLVHKRAVRRSRRFDQGATTAAAGGDELRGIIKIASRPVEDWSRVRAGVPLAAAILAEGRGICRFMKTLGTIIKDYPKARMSRLLVIHWQSSSGRRRQPPWKLSFNVNKLWNCSITRRDFVGKAAITAFGAAITTGGPGM